MSLKDIIPSTSPIAFPGLFGDWQFTASNKALDVGNGVYWYGIFIAAGLLIGLWFCIKQAPKFRLSEDNVMDAVLWSMPIGILGARRAPPARKARIRSTSTARWTALWTSAG